MDLGIAGKAAIVCGASKGLGFGCAEALAAEGVHLTMVARGEEALAPAAADLRKRYGVEVTYVAADLAAQSGRDAVLAAMPEPDILIVNAGGPPVKDYKTLSREDWIHALDANLYGMTDLINRVVGSMEAKQFGRIVTITSGSVKSPMVGLDLSNAMRSGLVAYSKGIAAALAPHNVTINSLLPGLYATERLDAIFFARAGAMNLTVEQVAEFMQQSIPAKRFGTAEEFGQCCAFLCSVHASYMTGQALLLDGGAYPGVA